MKYRLTPNLNDGLRNAPPLVVECFDEGDLLEAVAEELANDGGELFGVGFTLTIERTE